MSRLLDLLPRDQRRLKEFKEITRTEEVEFDALRFDFKDLENQLVVDTATWGLAIYEKELRLPIKPNKTLEERRSIIRAKMRGIGKVDYLMIQSTVEAFTGQIVEVGFANKIQIIFKREGSIKFTEDLIQAIDEVKPAHLAFTLENHLKSKLKIRSYVYEGSSSFPLCNTIEAGNWWYQQNTGKRKNQIIKVDSSIGDKSFNYPLAGDTVAKESEIYG